MPKVIRIITRLNIGGPAIHAILLSSERDLKKGRDIIVCGKVSAGEGDMAPFAVEKGVVPIVVDEMQREISISSDFKALLKLCKIIKREKPDIVHTHTAKAGTLGRIAAILTGVPIKVHTFHGHIFDGYFSPLKAKVFLAIEKALALFTDKVLTVSESVKDEITNSLKVTSREKCAVIPLGFELEKFVDCAACKGEFKKDLGLPADTLLIGIVGRLVPIKNHRLFLDAARKVIDSYKGENLRFIVVGGGELAAELEAYAKAIGLKEHVLFAGWRRDLPTVYADLDVVTLTSLNEGTPVSLIEALASQKAVIATDVGGVRDLLDDKVNGFLVRSGDVDGLADKILFLLRNKDEGSKLGACGRRSVIEKYSKERLLNDIETLYRDLMNKRSRKR